MIDDIALFVHIVDHQSLAGCAAYLKVPPATVTRRLKKLEDRLGCQLIYRSARKFHLTREGESYYQAFGEHIHQIEDMARDLNADIHQLSGRLKVLAPENISIGYLQPMWSAFIQTYPDIQLDLQLNNAMEDFHFTQADIALRIGPQPDQGLYQKKLGALPTYMVASPDYLEHHSPIQSLTDLAEHRLIILSGQPVWTLMRPGLKGQEILQLRATTLVNDVRLASQLACDGLGIALLPLSETYQGLQDGHLQRLLAPWEGPQREMFAIWPSQRLMNAKTKVMRDFLVDWCTTLPGGVFT